MAYSTMCQFLDHPAYRIFYCFDKTELIEMTATQAVRKSNLQCYSLRLKPGEELYSSLLKYKRENDLQAAFIMTCCGSLTKATIRLAAHSADNPNNVQYAPPNHYRIDINKLY